MFSFKLWMNPGALTAKPLLGQQCLYEEGDVHLHKVSEVGPPVDTIGVVVPSSFVKRVEIIDPNVTSPDEPVICDHRSGDTTQ